MQPAVQAWADKVNKTGGIAGRPVLVVVGDDANDPAAQLRLVQEMVEQRSVVAFAGMPAADTQDASVEYLEAKGVPVTGGVLANPAWGTSPIMFPQGVGGQQKLRLLTRAAATSGKTRWAFIGLLESDVDAAARASRGRAAEEAGIQVVFDGQIYPGAPDAAAMPFRQARRGRADEHCRGPRHPGDSRRVLRARAVPPDLRDTAPSDDQRSWTLSATRWKAPSAHRGPSVDGR